MRRFAFGVTPLALALTASSALAQSPAPPADAAAQVPPTAPRAERFATNPLITVGSSPTLGGNVNGPTVIRVPDWMERPLGRYYMYFANHMGLEIRLAYADALTGPWRIHEPGVLHVADTEFFRPQPDPEGALADFYTHVASPEILVDHERRRLVMWVHGWWTNGEGWPETLAEARAWARERGYAQRTQAAVSEDGLTFDPVPGITRTSYLRVFEHQGTFYGVSRLGLLSRTSDVLTPFETGASVFRDGPYAGRVRHVALVKSAGELEVYFTAIGDAPERVMVATVPLVGDWTTWRAGDAVEALRPQAPYECTNLPNVPSEGGDIAVPAHQIRDPFVFLEDGRSYLFYAICGEQGIAGAALQP